MRKPLLIAITGPTASGKSALAVELATRLRTEIISADSRQIYKGIPIATAVPTEEERGGIPHHLLEVLELEDYFSASKFEEESLKILEEIFKTSDVAVVCGGSMLYVDSLLYGIDELPTVPDELRNELMTEWKERGDAWLLGRLKELDNMYYERVDPNNLKRVFHAVEVSLTAGRPYSSLLGKERRARNFEYKKVCLGGDRNELFKRINRRTLEMIDKGLEDEARRVSAFRNLNSINTVGLKEMFLYFDGKFTREEAISRIQKNTRVYAKKQLTWHKRDDKAVWLNLTDGPKQNSSRILDMVLQKGY